MVVKTKKKTDPQAGDSEDLCRRLLRHIVALRLKEIDALATLEIKLGHQGIPRLDIIEQVIGEMGAANADSLTDAEVDAALAKWRS